VDSHLAQSMINALNSPPD